MSFNTLSEDVKLFTRTATASYYNTAFIPTRTGGVNSGGVIGDGVNDGELSTAAMSTVKLLIFILLLLSGMWLIPIFYLPILIYVPELGLNRQWGSEYLCFSLRLFACSEYT